MNYKLTFFHYAASVGALLAVSGSANAVILPGKFLPIGPYSDAILDHDYDRVFIDLNDDDQPDFLLAFESHTRTTSTGSTTLFVTERIVDIIAASSCFIDNTLQYIASSSTNIFARNNQLNDAIGPISYPYDRGIISMYTDPAPSTPIPLTPDFDGTNGDEGYIGVGKTSPEGTYYGWIHITIGPECTPVTFDTCALEYYPNRPIAAGDSTPVPLLPIASAAGLGLIGLMAAMKKRKKVTA
ncbi:MAG: hypothetical protein K9H26_06210 [Prolixibacteraceae bacterium]|nr:hypothetical protein [Prolixibacteraceae bacterium]